LSKRASTSWSCGASAKQINAPETSGIPHVTIYAYASGTVVDRKVTQGQYVNAGDTLFTVADLSQVWIKADVYEEQLPQIRAGQEVEITAEALPNRTLHGHVDFIEPSANPQTRTVPVHVHVANPGMRLLPGMFVSATFVSRAAQPTIVVPRSAVLDTGTRKIVYLARPNGVFEAREVQVGAPNEDLFPVPAVWRWATRWCSMATSSSIRRRTSARECRVSMADRKSSAPPASFPSASNGIGAARGARSTSMQTPIR
jgi:RND family efflux transporter MFP subunit